MPVPGLTAGGPLPPNLTFRGGDSGRVTVAPNIAQGAFSLGSGRASTTTAQDVPSAVAQAATSPPVLWIGLALFGGIAAGALLRK